MNCEQDNNHANIKLNSNGKKITENITHRKKYRFQIINKRAVKRLSVLAIVVFLSGFCGWWIMINMPGESYSGPLPALSKNEITLQNLIQQHVKMLSVTIGPRHIEKWDKLEQTAAYIELSFIQAGLQPVRQKFNVNGSEVANIEIEIPGSSYPDQIIIIGAHYDSALIAVGDDPDCPGANDNASGVAAALALAKAFADKKPDRTIRFVLFVNEEPPYFSTRNMGSLVYARRCKADNDNIVAMLSLETIGYYSDKPRSQKYPFPVGLIYPDKGNFITFVGNVSSHKLVKKAIRIFRQHTKFPSQGGALPAAIPGVGWSDHGPFWEQGYPAIMITDTAPNRYPFYHTTDDTWDKLDYARMAIVVQGLENVIRELASVK